MVTLSPDYSNVERQENLLHYIETHQRISVQEVCDLFQISLATARRDLESLAEQGKVQRVHGGAIAVRRAPPEPPVVQRSAQMSQEKKRIGRTTASLILDGETVFLGSGSTVLEAALPLRERPASANLTVITNSLLVCNALADAPGVNLVGLGGVLRSSEMSFIGHITEQALNEVHADKVVLGIHAIDIQHGLTNDYLPETMTDRAILKVGHQVILVADHTKCGCVSTAFVAPVHAVDTLVTDQGIDPLFTAELANLGIQVITC
jgi:DeoR family transcriptional regulator of aga operon